MLQCSHNDDEVKVNGSSSNGTEWRLRLKKKKILLPNYRLDPPVSHEWVTMMLAKTKQVLKADFK